MPMEPALSGKNAIVADPAGSSIRDLDDTALNRLWRDADIRRTPPPGLRRRPRGKEEALAPTPNMDEKSRKAAQIEYGRTADELRRRIGKMSDEDLGAHLRRLKIDCFSGFPPSDNDSPDKGDWAQSLLFSEWQKRQEQSAKERIKTQLEELKAEVLSMDDAKLAAERFKIEDINREERSADQNNKLDFIRHEMVRRDKVHRSAIDRRDRIRTIVTIFNLVVAIAAFIMAQAAYFRTQPLNSVVSSTNAPALVVPSTSAPSNANGATPHPVPPHTPANAAPK